VTVGSQSWQIALEGDRQDASYPIREWTWLHGTTGPTGPSAKSARAVVEVRRGGGRLLPLVLLSGEASATSDDSKAGPGSREPDSSTLEG
jgi:hypothetical protein